jgi:hypothetical protein
MYIIIVIFFNLYIYLYISYKTPSVTRIAYHALKEPASVLLYFL